MTWRKTTSEPACRFPDRKAYTGYRKGCRCRRCKDANNDWQKAYHRRRPGLATGYYRRLKYGIEPSKVAGMYAAQAGGCKICNRTGRLFVDHCHTTGRVRGLLCPKCNSAIGLLRDDPKLCLAAAEYLAGHAPKGKR